MGLYPNRWLCSSPSFPQGDFLALMSFSSCKGRSSWGGSDSGPLSEGELVLSTLKLEGRRSEVMSLLGLALLKNSEPRGSLQGFIRYRLRCCFCCLHSLPNQPPWCDGLALLSQKPCPQTLLLMEYFFLYQVVWLAVTHLWFC